MSVKRSRRQFLGAGLAAMSVFALAACSPESEGLAEQAGDDKGYISGEGVITQLAVSDRGEPVEFSGELLDGTSFSLEEWRGAPVVINLWYAACPPCRTEAPELQGVYDEYQADGVRFLGVNVRDQAPAAEAFIRNFSVTYPNVLDSQNEVVTALHGVLPPQATPSTVVLDREGRPAARVVGAVDASTLSGLLDDVLDED